MSDMATDAQKRAKNKFGREKMTAITFRMHKANDAELIQIYRSIPDKAEWFRSALREYGKRTK